MKKRDLLVCIIILLAACNAVAQECPKVGSYRDLNCDGEFRIAFLGDSFVSGTGDTKYKNKGGYVLRVGRRLKNVKAENLGIAGVTAVNLLAFVEAGFTEGGSKSQKRYAETLSESDVVVLDVGRNDRWESESPKATFDVLRRLKSTVESLVEERSSYTPYVVQAAIMLPNRGAQGPFVKSLNEIIVKAQSKAYPSDLRFDLVSKRLLGSDQLHPTPKGYDALTDTFLKYLKQKITPRLSSF